MRQEATHWQTDFVVAAADHLWHWWVKQHLQDESLFQRGGDQSGKAIEEQEADKEVRALWSPRVWERSRVRSSGLVVGGGSTKKAGKGIGR